MCSLEDTALYVHLYPRCHARMGLPWRPHVMRQMHGLKRRCHGETLRRVTNQQWSGHMHTANTHELARLRTLRPHSAMTRRRTIPHGAQVQVCLYVAPLEWSAPVGRLMLNRTSIL